MSSASENRTEKLHIFCNSDRSFHSSRGLRQHQRSYQSRNNTTTDRESTETIEDSQFSTKTLKSADEFSTQREIHLGKLQRSWVWKELIISLWNCRVLEKKSVLVTIWESGMKLSCFREKISSCHHLGKQEKSLSERRSFKINEWMAT